MQNSALRPKEPAHFFCIHKESHHLLGKYPTVLVIDCIYKTNQFNMPLFNVVGMTGRNTTFFICFAFLNGEKGEDYNWALHQLRDV